MSAFRFGICFHGCHRSGSPESDIATDALTISCAHDFRFTTLKKKKRKTDADLCVRARNACTHNDPARINEDVNDNLYVKKTK